MLGRFAVLTDSHLGALGGHGVHNTLDGDSLAPRLAAAGAMLDDCAFCLHLGDVVDRGEAPLLEQAAEILGRYPCPVYIALGNHDAVEPGQRAAFATVLRAHLAAPGPGGALEVFGWRFLVLHSWWRDPAGEPRDHWSFGTACEWVVPVEQLRWLEAELAAHPDQPTCIAHHPLSVPISARLTGGAEMHLPPAGAAAALDSVLARHPQVRVLFGGHAHVHQIECRDGLWHIATGCLSEYPHEMRLVDVRSDGLWIRTQPVPGPIDRELARPWTAGQACDRECFVPAMP